MTDIPLSLYIHIPWCVRKCPYCDFNSHEAQGRIPEAQYVETLLLDLAAEAEAQPASHLTSIFIGGGTPSLFSAEAITQLLDGVRGHYLLQDTSNNEIEVTMEANPGTFDQGHFDGYRAAGVNRLSIGAQSFSADALKALGRIHEPTDIARAFSGARQAGFSRINLDLMHGLPGQSLSDAMSDLEQAINLGPEHISWYQLTIEPNTRFYRYPPLLPNDTVLEDIYLRGNDLLHAAGYTRYEVSAYSQPAEASRHNLNYWQFGDYLGIGAGAHGKITRDNQVLRTTRNRVPAEYLRNPQGKTRAVSPDELLLEFLLNTLRLTNGFDCSLFGERTGQDPKLLESFLDKASDQGYLNRIGNLVQPTEKGQLFLNDLLLLAN